MAGRKLRRRNKLAKQNGMKAEEIAVQYLSTFFDDGELIEIVNSIIDIVINDSIPVEVKSCQEKIKDASESKGYRAGRFTLNKEQHNYLVSRKGYYLFIVFLENGNCLIRFVKASLIPYKQKLTWWKLFDYIDENNKRDDDVLEKEEYIEKN